MDSLEEFKELMIANEAMLSALLEYEAWRSIECENVKEKLGVLRREISESKHWIESEESDNILYAFRMFVEACEDYYPPSPKWDNVQAKVRALHQKVSTIRTTEESGPT
jgi:hypothetical protein